MQRILPLRAVALAVFVLVSCSESGTRSPTAPMTIADPTVNRIQKSDRDGADWRPSRNTGWFAARVVAVKQKYGLSVNPAERDALASMLASDSSRSVTCN